MVLEIMQVTPFTVSCKCVRVAIAWGDLLGSNIRFATLILPPHRPPVLSLLFWCWKRPSGPWSRLKTLASQAYASPLDSSSEAFWGSWQQFHPGFIISKKVSHWLCDRKQFWHWINVFQLTGEIWTTLLLPCAVKSLPVILLDEVAMLTCRDNSCTCDYTADSHTDQLQH